MIRGFMTANAIESWKWLKDRPANYIPALLWKVDGNSFGEPAGRTPVLVLDDKEEEELYALAYAACVLAEHGDKAEENESVTVPLRALLARIEEEPQS